MGSRYHRWPDGAGFVAYRKQALWHFCQFKTPLCRLFACQHPFFKYNWKKEAWNLFFAGGILLGGAIAAFFLPDPNPVQVAPALAEELAGYGIQNYTHVVPADLFSWDSLLTLRGFILMVAGGFLVGFGTRYAGGCTSGHAIMGLSTLQWPSLSLPSPSWWAAY